MISPIHSLALALLIVPLTATLAADYPAPAEGDYVIRDFKFASREMLPELKIHHRTIGKAVKDERGRRAETPVLITHGTRQRRAIHPAGIRGELFGAGQPRLMPRVFHRAPDGIGHGKSRKPSDGMRAKVSAQRLRGQWVEAPFRLLTDGSRRKPHARLVMGTSMGGMQTGFWGETHPDFMDALLPLCVVCRRRFRRNRAWAG